MMETRDLDEKTGAVLREIAKLLRSDELRSKCGTGNDWADFFEELADYAATGKHRAMAAPK